MVWQYQILEHLFNIMGCCALFLLLYTECKLGWFWAWYVAHQSSHAVKFAYFSYRQEISWKRFYLSVMQDSWRELANAFANGRTLFSLHSTHQVRTSYMLWPVELYLSLTFILILLQRSLAQTLVLSASGMRNPEASNQWVSFPLFKPFFFLVSFACSVYAAVLPDVLGTISWKVCKGSHKSYDSISSGNVQQEWLKKFLSTTRHYLVGRCWKFW